MSLARAPDSPRQVVPLLGLALHLLQLELVLLLLDLGDELHVLVAALVVGLVVLVDYLGVPCDKLLI